MGQPRKDATVKSAAGAVRVRLVGTAPGAPVVVHLHGGSFTGGSPEESAGLVDLLVEAGAQVVCVDYPHAGDHPFPAALDAAADVLRWAARRRGAGSGLFVAGEEAGANLAAALALVARDRQGPAVAGQILLSPMLDPCLATCSARTARVGATDCRFAAGWHAYLGRPEVGAHPYAAPLYAHRLKGLPPALVVSAADDPFRDEAARYAAALSAAGVNVRSALLPAPTGWPDALCTAAAGPLDPRWAQPLRAIVSAFLHAPAVRETAAATS